MNFPGNPRVARPGLGLATYFGYAAGDMGCNLAFSMFGMFLLLYYTDVAKINAAAVGTLFLVVRIWDAFADVFASLPGRCGWRSCLRRLRVSALSCSTR